MINLITGSTGFIGNCLKDRLLCQGKCVAWVSRNGDVVVQRLPQEPKETTIAELEKTNEPIIVYSLATNYDPAPDDMAAVEALIESNVLFPLRLLHQFSSFRNIQVIYTCSYHQLLPLKYSNQYSVSKEYLCTFLRQKQIKHKLVYLYDTYGPNDKRNKVIDTFIKRILLNQEIRIPEDPIQVNLSHVDNVITGLLAASTATGTCFEIFSPNTVDLKSLASLLMKIIDKKVPIKMAGTAENLLSKIQFKPPNIHPESDTNELYEGLRSKVIEIGKSKKI